MSHLNKSSLMKPSMRGGTVSRCRDSASAVRFNLESGDRAYSCNEREILATELSHALRLSYHRARARIRQAGAKIRGKQTERMRRRRRRVSA